MYGAVLVPPIPILDPAPSQRVRELPGLGGTLCIGDAVVPIADSFDDEVVGL